MGEITVSGGKNTAVAVIPAVLLCDEPCTIENLPDIDDVHATSFQKGLTGFDSGQKWWVSMQCVGDLHFNLSYQNFIWRN